MKKFLSILLSIIFALCLLATLVLSVVRFNFNTSTITEFATQIFKVSKAPVIEYEDDGLFHPDQKSITYAQYSPDDFDLSGFDMSSIDLTNMDINEIVQAYLEDYDVDPAVVSEILASPEITQTVSQYADEIINYITGASEELNIDPVQLTKVVNNAIDKYEEATGEVIDRTGLDEMIAEGVEAAVPELTATLDTAKEENAEAFEILRKVNIVLSLKVFIIAIAVCAVLALIIFLINMNVFVWFKYISIPALVDGLLIFIATLVAKGIVPGILLAAIKDAGLGDSVYSLIWKFVFVILKKFEIYGIVTTLIGVVLLCLGATLGKKKQPKPAAVTSQNSDETIVQE